MSDNKLPQVRRRNDPENRPALRKSERTRQSILDAALKFLWTHPAKNNKRDKLDINMDGSVTLYLAQKAPKGKEANWIQTVPGKGWFACLRIYGPLQPWFDKTWRPGEIELVK